MKNNHKRELHKLRVVEISKKQQQQLKGGDDDGDIGIEDYIDG